MSSVKIYRNRSATESFGPMEGHRNMCGAFTREDFFNFFSKGENELVEGIVCTRPAEPTPEQETIIEHILEELSKAYPENQYLMHRKPFLVFDEYNIVVPEIAVMEKDGDTGEIAWGVPELVFELELNPIKLNLYKIFGVSEYRAFKTAGTVELVQYSL